MPSSNSTVSAETQETISGYDRVAAQYATRWESLRLERALTTFVDQLTGRRLVLDLGCGPGRDIGFLRDLGCRPLGLDRSTGMLAQARFRLPSTGLVAADLRQPPFRADCLDGVWACASLLHLRRDQLPATITEIARLLRRPGGAFYVAMKAGQGQRWIESPDGRRAFYAFYQPSELETVLVAAGFHVVEGWLEADSAGRAESWINLVTVLGYA
jgi:SAM-dependent methyltransferase